MVDIVRGADLVQVLIAIFKERHQTDLARIVIFSFVRMTLFVPLSETKFGQFLCSFFLFQLLFVDLLLPVVLDFDSSLFVFFYLEVHQLLREFILTS